MKINPSPQLTPNEKNLIRRYLVWCYKTTKEDLDRIDRYYTQIQVDHFMLDVLKNDKNDKGGGEAYSQLVDNFKIYIATKKNNVDGKKFKDVSRQIPTADYLYLKNRFAAIEKAIIYFLGKNEFKNITKLYETEMTRRILEAREHI